MSPPYLPDMFAEMPTLPRTDGTLEERLLAKLESFLGQQFSQQTQARMQAEIMGELARARDTGELEYDDLSKVEVVFEKSVDLYGTRVVIREKQPEPPPAPKVKEPRGPSTPPDNDWESRMTPEEVRWCHQQIDAKAKGLFYVDNRRAARIWKSTQRRRFRRIESYGCCGSTNFVERRWSISKNRWDYYLLGFNFGH